MSRYWAALQPIEPGELRFRADQMARAFTDRGVTYAFAGEERPWPLDLVPRILDALEWDLVQRGVSPRGEGPGGLPLRRLRARPRLRGRGRALASPAEPPHFHRAAHGIERTRRRTDPRRRHRSRTGRGGTSGSWRTTSRAVRGLGHHPEPACDDQDLSVPLRRTARRPRGRLRAETSGGPRAAAPDGVGDPRVVVLTPGPSNAAYFEHALLARLMVQLVEGHDLACRNNRVLDADHAGRDAGACRIPTARRRLPRSAALPAHSAIGCRVPSAAPGGHRHARQRRGQRHRHDKLLYTYVPDLIRYYLGAACSPNVKSYRPDEPGQLEAVLDQIDQLVIKPVDGAGGQGIAMGPRPTGTPWSAPGRPSPPTRVAGSRSGPWRSPPRPPSRATGWRPATSTCARSPSTTARTSGYCPAAAHQGRPPGGYSSSTPVRAAAPGTPALAEGPPSSPEFSTSNRGDLDRRGRRRRRHGVGCGPAPARTTAPVASYRKGHSSSERRDPLPHSRGRPGRLLRRAADATAASSTPTSTASWRTPAPDEDVACRSRTPSSVSTLRTRRHAAGPG